jgi:hypothetical protein
MIFGDLVHLVPLFHVVVWHIKNAHCFLKKYLNLIYYINYKLQQNNKKGDRVIVATKNNVFNATN